MKLPWKISRDPFIRLSDLSRAAGSYTLPESDIRYAVTGDYADRARNHCACVCCVNLVLFFRALEEKSAPSPVRRMTREEREALKRSRAAYRDALFERIHERLGNGPVFSIRREALRLLEENGFEAGILRIRPSDREGMIRALDRGIPLALLLRISPFNWHWILAVGYRHYENYDAIDIPFTDAIPIDYNGKMGVPKTFLDKYCPEQFEIIGIAEGDSGKELGLKPYPRELKKLNKSLRDGQLYYIDENGIPQKPYARIIIRKKQ